MDVPFRGLCHLLYLGVSLGKTVFERHFGFFEALNQAEPTEVVVGKYPQSGAAFLKKREQSFFLGNILSVCAVKPVLWATWPIEYPMI